MLALARRLALVLIGLMALAVPAAAAQTGTPAWSLKALTLRSGPGAAYDLAGEISGKIRITVDRCSKRWCLVRAEGHKGWASLDHIGFGQEARYPLTGPRLNYPGGDGEVCLYTGQKYSGAAFCAPSGSVLRDLKRYGHDNVFASLRITGNASVTLCSSANFAAYCQRFIKDTPNLGQFLSRQVSSARVH